jgi:ubiquinone/menaquinone biosynthesis C-methylase UbiE
MALSDFIKPLKLNSPDQMVRKLGAHAIRSAAEKFLRGVTLDIGCGTKAKEQLVGDLVEKYVGLDHPDSLHDQSKVDIVASAYDIPGPEQQFDSILCTAVLEHLEEPEAALREAWRVLKPGGYAIYTIPFFWHLHEEPRDFYRYSRYGIEHLFRKAGFTELEIIPLSGFWVTFGSAWSYYLQNFRKGLFRYPVDLLVVFNNLICPRLDRLVRDVRFSWLHLVVARKPIEKKIADE